MKIIFFHTCEHAAIGVETYEVEHSFDYCPKCLANLDEKKRKLFEALEQGTTTWVEKELEERGL